MMKWRVRRDSNCSSIEHEDIRRSLDVLDSVLAEFDDCLDSWDTQTVEYRNTGSLTKKKFISEELKLNGSRFYETHPGEDKLCCQPSATDGSSSHVVGSGSEQSRVSSPPPIPKRSPTTRLSEYNSPESFAFPTNETTTTTPIHSDDTSLQGSVDLSHNPPPEHVQIRPRLSAAERDDDCQDYSDSSCSNCGRRLRHCDDNNSMEQSPESPSVFLQRKQVFESMTATSPCPGMPSFRARKKTPDQTNLSSESGIDNDSGSEMPRSDAAAEDSASSYINGPHVPDCKCSDRIRVLSSRFSETRRLLQLNRIKGLDSPPPSFQPPPPPENGLPRRLQRKPTKSRRSHSSERPDGARTDNPPNNANLNHVQSLSSLSQSQLNYSTKSADDSSSPNSSKLDWTGSLESLRLCNRCSSSCSETVEDLPKLLPTDALNRPYLGLSYSMEDDLSPGVKEIRQVSTMVTSTPKSNQSSSPNLYRSKDESGLSTFSQSASSLGYVSSQSDLELNQIPNVPDKVPVSTFRSRTLPNALDRSPFYSAAEEFYTLPKENGTLSERDPKIYPFSGEESECRSSSAPPPPEVEKPRKHFRVFSRKSKKNKSGATP